MTMNTLSKNQAISILIVLGILLVGGTALVQNKRVSPNRATDAFSTDIAGLPDAQLSQVVELNNGDTYNLTASLVQKTINGQSVKMLAYNGSIPGPTIQVQQGSEITIKFTNNSDVETTLHSHGVRMANEFDGTPDVTQKPIPIDGTFTYKLKFPDAGIYWYHPHIREDYAQELGLYGTFLVVSDDPNYWQPVNQEVPLMLDDILMEGGNIAPFDLVADRTLMGRFGNVMFINGKTDYRLNAKQGEIIRFYLTNTASTRTFNVTIPNTKMKLVGADGGKYERETFVDSIVIAPSERAILEVLFDKPGTFMLQHKTPDRTYTLGNIIIDLERVTTSYLRQFNTLRTNQDIIASIDPFRPSFAKTADKKLALTIDMMGMPAGQAGMGTHGGHMISGSSEAIEWEDDMMMNQMSTTRNIQWKITDMDTNKSNMDIDWKFKVGDIAKIQIFNDPKSMHPMQHPIHFHGQRFLVLSTNGIQNDNLTWKDTALIKTGDTVELLVDMSNPGTWMAHCHIAEHLEDGMMFNFTVSQ